MLFSGIGPFEIAIVVIAIILIFGIEKIPEIAKNIAYGIKEFKKTVNDIN